MIKVLHNHAIFLLMIISLLYITFDLPFIISYYHLHYDRFRTRSFCLWWYWLDYTLVLISLFLTATASIQRHILVFNARWLHGTRRRWILHYIPLIFCIFYPSLFYFILIFFYSCVTSFDDETLSCPFPCYSNGQYCIDMSSDLFDRKISPSSITYLEKTKKINITIISFFITLCHWMGSINSYIYYTHVVST